MIKTITRITLPVVALLMISVTPSMSKVDIVTTSTDLGDIARNVGGDKVNVTALMRGDQNAHTVEPRPSQVSKLSRADLFVRIGMDLDMWADSLMEASRNRKIQKGEDGYVDASSGIKKFEVPTDRVDASKGDVHVFGNPHYWTDPENAKTIARNILNGLKRVDRANDDYYQKNYNTFVDKLGDKMKGWQKSMASCKGKEIVTYHKSWIYFLKRFGLKEAGTVEPKPGIPPSPSHLRSLVSDMKSNDVHVILMESFYSRKFPDAVAKQTGAKIVEAPISVGGAKGVDSYFELIDTIVKRLSDAL